MESGQILSVREMYRKCMLQVKGSYRGHMQDGDHTDGHYFTLFAEQLTRPFEVLVVIRDNSKKYFDIFLRFYPACILLNQKQFQELVGVNL